MALHKGAEPMPCSTDQDAAPGTQTWCRGRGVLQRAVETGSMGMTFCCLASIY
jgi:hypothetical protein